ncbi:hypothetical protein B7Z17_04355, partial [Candidatus Saccharibacteria bacterium 32-49-10]
MNKKRGVAVSLYAGAFFLIITLLTLSYGGKSINSQTGPSSVAQASSSATVGTTQEKVSADQLTAASAVT